MSSQSLIEITDLRHSYKNREVLKGVSFSVNRGEIFGLLGPNGSGKTTLFRILSTLLRAASGKIKIAGLELPGDETAVRKKTGIVFQSPSVDGKLTVRENMTHQGHLYGLYGTDLSRRISEMLARLGLEDRAGEIVDKLSGGLKRRVELAKGLLHKPEVLILDEPSTGLDPGARINLWKYLKELRDSQQMTILVTTHLMEEAEHCNRIGILSEGRFVNSGRPDELKKKIGGDVIVIKTSNPDVLARRIQEKFHTKAVSLSGAVQVEHEKGAELAARFAGAFPEEIEAVTFRRPTLEDVFVKETGHKFWTAEEETE